MAPPAPSPKVSPSDRVDLASFLAGAKEIDQFPPPVLLEVAFAGRSNVGKSSLMNSLLQRSGLVRTSGTPGCTRQISWFHAKTGDGAELCLTDLPGYGYARRSKDERRTWARVIEAYLLGRPTLRAVVLLTDARRGFEQDDHDLVELLQGQAETSRPPVQVILVGTKLDKLSVSARKPALAELDRSELPRSIGSKVIGYSTVENIGRRELWHKVRQALGLLAPAAEPQEAGHQGGTPPR